MISGNQLKQRIPAGKWKETGFRTLSPVFPLIEGIKVLNYVKKECVDLYILSLIIFFAKNFKTWI
jgi:hypothetical protein